MRSTLRFLLVISFLCWHAFTFAGELTGLVVGVSDGDTLTLLVNQHDRYKVRLAGIDSPEKRQPYYEVAKRALSDLAFKREATVRFSKRDRFDRILGKVLIGGQDINLLMIASGLAWHYKRYQGDQSTEDRNSYSLAETQARYAHLGLWQDPEPLAPWIFRKNKQQKNL